MKKYFVLNLMLFLSFIVFSVNADEGKDATFKSLRCSMCHKPDTGKSFPSLKEISKAYKGDKEKLVGYLKGTSEPIVKEKSKTMDRYLEKTKELSSKEVKMLAEFIMGE